MKYDLASIFGSTAVVVEEMRAVVERERSASPDDRLCETDLWDLILSWADCFQELTVDVENWGEALKRVRQRLVDGSPATDWGRRDMLKEVDAALSRVPVDGGHQA